MAISSNVSLTRDALPAAGTVSCPKCGSAIPINEALSQQARENAAKDLELQRKELEQAFAQREQKLQAGREEIEAAKAKVKEEVAAQIAVEREQLTARLRKELETQKGHELTALKEQLDRKNKAIEEGSQKQLELMRQSAAFEERERKLKFEMQQQVEAAQGKVQAEVATRLEKEKAGIAARVREEMEAAKGTEVAALKEQLELRRRQVEEAGRKELDLLKQKAALEEQKNQLNLEVARQLDAERAKIAEHAKSAVLEESRLKLLEKDKQAEDLRREIETLRQKASQGSMQTQGEVLELDFEARLRAEFPFDEISPISTGQRGADLQQVVRTSPTNVCGTILWEAKRTRAWSSQWIAKLKSDQRDAKAELAVIITQALPKEVSCFGCMEGIWVTDFASALPLALSLRHGLLSMAAVRQSETGKRGKMEDLYALMTSTEFRQQVESIVEAFKTLSADLESERTAMERIWAKREKRLRMALQSTARLYGGVQNVLGATALPDVAALSLPAAQD